MLRQQQVVALMFLFVVYLLATPVISAPLRLVCNHEPPMVRAFFTADGTPYCTGPFADFVLAALEDLGLEYVFLNHTEIKAAIGGANMRKSLILDKSTNQSLADIALMRDSVAQSSIVDCAFFQPFFQSDYKAVVYAKYKPTKPQPVDAVMRPAVMYIFGIVLLIVYLVFILVFALESFRKDNKMRRKPLHMKIGWAVESAIEMVFTMANTDPVGSHFLRVIRMVVICLSVFLMAIFGSLVTSKLSAAAINVKPLTLRDLRGMSLIVVSSNLQRYLPSPSVGVKAIFVNGTTLSIGELALKWHAQDPLVAKYDGYAHNTPLVDYTFAHGSGMQERGVVVTSFTLEGGVLNSQAVPFSYGLNKSIAEMIDVILVKARNNGSFAAALAKVAPAQDFVTSNEMDLDPRSTVTVRVLCLFLFTTLASFVLIRRIFVESDNWCWPSSFVLPTDDDSNNQGSAAPATNELIFDGVRYAVAKDSLSEAMLDVLAKRAKPCTKLE